MMHTPTRFQRRRTAWSLVLGVVVLASCTSDTPTTPSEAPTPTDVSWTHCPGVFAPDIAWFAVQDGTGPWRRVTETSHTFSFHLDSGRAAVAYTDASPLPYSSTYVRFFTAGELRAIQPLCDRRAFSPAEGKRISGSISGLGPLDEADIALGRETAYVSGPASTDEPVGFTLSGLESAAADLIAVKHLRCTSPSTCTAPPAMIIRRGIDPPNESTLPPLDFTDASESFELVSRTLTIGNLVGGETFAASETFQTATTTVGVTLMNKTDGSANAVSARIAYYTLPNDRQLSGDVSRLYISTRLPAATRELIAEVRGSGDEAVALGPALPSVSITAAQQSGFTTIHAEVPNQGTFATWGAEYIQRGVVGIYVRISSGYSRSGMVNVGVPSFAGSSGWSSEWGLRKGVPTSWTVFGLDMDPVSIENSLAPSFLRLRIATRFGMLTP